MRLAHCSDLHLDHVDEWQRLEFAQAAADKSDAMVITGDIASGTELQLLAELATDYQKPIFFVLGNHDYWGRSYKAVAEDIRNWCARMPNLTWLDDSNPVTLVPGVQLCGMGGWYDACFGDPNAGVVMNDWLRIEDLRPHYYNGTLIEKCRDIAVNAARRATGKLLATDAKRVFFATHVPPYHESAQHECKPSSPAFLPWYTSRSMGVALTDFARRRPEQRLTTLCGHVHSASIFKASGNHTVLTAGAVYGSPEVACVFDLGDGE